MNISIVNICCSLWFVYSKINNIKKKTINVQTPKLAVLAYGKI